MNIQQAREKLHKAGIYQLRHGESLQDALDYVDGKIRRKGYKIKHDDGRRMTKNEIIAESYREAFCRTITEPEYVERPLENPDDVRPINDYRSDFTKRGVLQYCYFCGESMRIDANEEMTEDYEEPPTSLDNCEDCMSVAIKHNCL